MERDTKMKPLMTQITQIVGIWVIRVVCGFH
jgi:hypothetical protein